MPTKRIVCLANSRKLAGRCIAGRVWGSKPSSWIRPVSARENEEVSEDERQYEDGSDPRVLDIVDVPLLEPKPKTYQQENWLLDPDQYWKKAGRLDWDWLASLVEFPGGLWLNESSTYHGLNDQISLDSASTLKCSLVLIKAKAVSLLLHRPGADFGNPKLRVQARFDHAGVGYWLRVTDPIIERNYVAKGEGQYELGECCLTISLSEPYKGHCYKLVAAIIEKL